MVGELSCDGIKWIGIGVWCLRDELNIGWEFFNFCIYHQWQYLT
jgi:hypothetical protein